MCVKILNRRTVVHLYDKNTDAVDQPALGMAPVLKGQFFKTISWKVIFWESKVNYFPGKSLSWKLISNIFHKSYYLGNWCKIEMTSRWCWIQSGVKSHAMSPQTEEMAPKYNPRKFSWILWQKLFCSFALSLLFSFREFHFGTSWNEIFANKNEIISCTAFSIPEVSTFWDQLTFSLCSVIQTRENVTGH